MALDTQDRRSSALGVALPFGRVLPRRDGTVSADDFEQVAYQYRGIQAGAVVEPPQPPAAVYTLAVTMTLRREAQVMCLLPRDATQTTGQARDLEVWLRLPRSRVRRVLVDD